MADDRKERYINPYTDFGFKKLFGTEMNKDRVFGKLFQQAEIAQYSEEKRRQYEASQKEYWDYTSTMDTAYMKGERKGHEAGLEEGLEKGRAEGRAEGIIETARKMKADGLPCETIAKYTGLTTEEITAL